jgi:hypothetical protein
LKIGATLVVLCGWLNADRIETSISSAEPVTSARTQSIRYEKDDRAANRRYPKKEHIQGKHKVRRPVLYAYLLVI